jgi:hypothetical protein
MKCSIIFVTLRKNLQQADIFAMKNLLRFVFVLTVCITGYYSQAQDTLPAFTVKNKNGKIILSWINNYSIVKQMSIQRSADSLKGFKTILTLPDPSSITNGFLDNNAPNTESFYKLYILLDSGKYVFSKAKKPQKDAPPVVIKTEKKVVDSAVAKSPVKKDTTTTKAIKPEPVAVSVTEPIAEAPSKLYEIERTRVSGKKKSDGLKSDTVNMVRPETFTPSGFIFTNADGNITVVLPIGKKEQFKIRFYDDKGENIFQVNNIKEHIVTIDKSNFMRAGWYSFELYEDNVLKEKNKVLVPKDASIR